jgi:hypothetical protein
MLEALLGGGGGGGGGGGTEPRRSRVRKRAAANGDGDGHPGPSTSGRPAPSATATGASDDQSAGACPICAMRLPLTELRAHVDAELAACLLEDEEEGGWNGQHNAHALLPPAPPAAGLALLAFGRGGGSRRGSVVPRPLARRAPPGWAATLAAIAARPGRVDHYSDVRAAAAVGIEGEALGIEGIASAATGWEVAGARGLGAGWEPPGAG